jgi:type I restriction-modification system DNA methylase subunit
MPPSFGGTLLSAQRALLAPFDELRDAARSACTLVFLHELSDTFTRAEPPPQARWQQITSHPASGLGETLDQACRACQSVWPTQLDGFFGEQRFSDQQPAALAAACETVQLLAREPRTRLVSDRRDLLASIHQNMRSITSKQLEGAFFTPWRVARSSMLATCTELPSDAWVIDKACGAGVLLHAAYEVYRAEHGPLAASAITMIGVDIDPRVCELARATLLLAGAEPDQYWITQGDALTQPLCGRDQSGTIRHLNFHAVIGNPPFGSRINQQALRSSPRPQPLIVPSEVLYRPILRSDSAPPGTPATPGDRRVA